MAASLIQQLLPNTPQPNTSWHGQQPSPCAHSVWLYPGPPPPTPPPPHTHVVFEPQSQPAAARVAARLRPEWVVAVSGSLRVRKDPNPRLDTGRVELLAEEVQVGGERWMGGGGVWQDGPGCGVSCFFGCWAPRGLARMPCKAFFRVGVGH
jgi:hypothetical protein